MVHGMSGAIKTVYAGFVGDGMGEGSQREGAQRTLRSQGGRLLAALILFLVLVLAVVLRLAAVLVLLVFLFSGRRLTGEAHRGSDPQCKERRQYDHVCETSHDRTSLDM